MSISEFRDICEKIYKNRENVNWPSGCSECFSENEWDCYHINDNGTEYYCPWRENFWKYEEVKNYIVLYKSKKGGLDINRLESLGYDDYIKLGILSEYI